jgi:hypothetical protein
LAAPKAARKAFSQDFADQFDGGSQSRAVVLYVLYFLRVEWYKAPRDPNDEKVAVRWQKRFGRGVALVPDPHPNSAIGECDFG